MCPSFWVSSNKSWWKLFWSFMKSCHWRLSSDDFCRVKIGESIGVGTKSFGLGLKMSWCSLKEYALKMRENFNIPLSTFIFSLILTALLRWRHQTLSDMTRYTTRIWCWSMWTVWSILMIRILQASPSQCQKCNNAWNACCDFYITIRLYSFLGMEFKSNFWNCDYH